jgi:transposase
LAFSKIRCFLPKSVFLKTPERIAALATIVGLSLMVYTLAQRQLRQALAAANETVPDQRNHQDFSKVPNLCLEDWTI